MDINEYRVGPSGNSERFYEEGYKHTYEAAKWIKDMGLNAFEYSFGRGVSLSEKTAKEISEAFGKENVAISAHAPYYINFANENPEMAAKSIGYVIETARAVLMMGGNRIVFHPAGQGKLSREKAFSLTMDRTKMLLERIEQDGLTNVIYCPETMGKIRQIGDLKEIIEMCKLSDMFLPCIDFGHLNARTYGSLKTTKDFTDVLDALYDNLGERVKRMHVHFSKIMYSDGGEVKHLTFLDHEYGPEVEPFCEAIVSRGFKPTIICESCGTQSDDAKQIAEIMLKTV